MNTTAPHKPSPVVNQWARPFWEACRDHKLTAQQCERCNKHIFYPRIACPHCGSDDLVWRELSGRGKIYSFTLVENNAPSAFVQDVPYVVAVIKLEEGIQMLSNIVNCDFSTLACEMPVKVCFEVLNDEFTLPKFMPVQD